MEESELVQRRERGRMAQRAFRQRQITTIRELKDKNQALADAIDNMTQTASLFSRMDTPSSRDKVMLEIGIQKARRLAGLAPLGEARPVMQGQETNDHFPQPDGQFWADPSSILESIEPQLETRRLGSSNMTTLPTRPWNSASPSVTSTVPLSIAQASDASSRASSPSMTVSIDGIFAADSSIKANTIINEINNQAGQYNNASTGDYFTSQALIPTSTTDPESETITASGRVSPRLTYGLWFEPDRFIRIINPPRDILPYLGNSTNTLAGAIFWAGMGYGFAILKKVLRMRAISSSYQPPPQSNTITYPNSSSSNDTSSPQPDAKAISTRLFGHAIRAAGPDGDAEQILHDVIHARFTWRKQGYIAGDHPGADPDIPTRLFAEVVKDMMETVPFPAPTSKIQVTTPAAENTISIPNEDFIPAAARTTWPAGLQFWMEPMEVEAYVRARLGSMAANQFDGNAKGWNTWEEAFQSRRGANTGYSPEPLSLERRSQLLKKLVMALSDKGVCFGNSPRWRVDVVSECVDEWMRDVEASEGWEVNNGANFGMGVSGENGGNGFYYNGSMAGYGGGGDIGMAARGSSSSSMYGSDFSVSEGVMEGVMEGLVF